MSMATKRAVAMAMRVAGKNEGNGKSSKRDGVGDEECNEGNKCGGGWS